MYVFEGRGEGYKYVKNVCMRGGDTYYQEVEGRGGKDTWFISRLWTNAYKI